MLHYAGDVTYNVNGWCCCFNCMRHVINHRLIHSQVSSIRTTTCCIETWKKRCRNRATMSSRRSSRSRKYRSMLFKFWLTDFWLVNTNLRLAICNCASKLLYCRLSIVFVYWFEFIAILFNNFLFFYFCYVFVFGKDNFRKQYKFLINSFIYLLFHCLNLISISLKRPETVGSQFRSSLGKLMVILMSKEPSYVRCIKPNDIKTPSKSLSRGLYLVMILLQCRLEEAWTRD